MFTLFLYCLGVKKLTEDENSHVVKLKPNQGKITYYFLSAWEKEPGGIKDEKQFRDYLTKVSRELANPVKVEVLINKKEIKSEWHASFKIK